MQAQPLSSPAARNLTPSGSSKSISEGPGLAHDAGNLLGALGLYCDLLDLPGVLRPEHLHYARELRLLSQRSGALIHRLLEADAETVIAAPPKRLCPATVMRAFTPLLRSLAAPQATLSMRVAPGLPELPFAAEVLERILVNLTRNAVTALQLHKPIDAAGNRGAGRIHIVVDGGVTRLRLTVTDNGPGMPAQAVAAFLKPAPLPRGALNGLGHHVVHDLVESTGGRLAITAVPDRGTALQIDWPVSAGKTMRGRSAAASTRDADPGRNMELLSNFSEGSRRKGAKLSC